MGEEVKKKGVGGGGERRVGNVVLGDQKPSDILKSYLYSI